MKTKEMENMNKVVKEIGTGPLCTNAALLDEVQKTLLDKGYAAAKVLVSQRAGADEQDEITRALAISQKYMLSPEAGAKVIQNLNVIKSGKW
ncbi:MAG: hypothetical protein WCY97_08475 [Methanothrix sp.]|uniref:Uncharacterized protein n=1 Tax=Methanothrix harundinacea TaxID=301375 RepID=A0A117LFN5_9EURY|nr:MAG: hypothetical protein APR56_04345 [Methanosaeta sp. SDB]KUK44590.1 MAG: Uncharacterized protein XD72_1042 [Methanothrix harundinacea]MDD2637899.1 hypothetical protein [Methanothrix sp.]MDI9398483.1 hypothetical protein [Euryarchaeota archaeon]KUK95562.1 MAG: Uncharacterized protein XE07_1760 [Methanothrix harundinacea]